MDLLDYCVTSMIESKIFALLIILTFLATYLYRKLTFWKRQGIPNDVFHTFKSLNNVLQLNDWNCVKRNGKIVGTYELLSPTLLVAEPKLINQILVEDSKKFFNRRILALPDQPMGKCLAYLEDYDLWKPSRHLVAPAFTFANLKKIRKLFEDSIQLFLNNIEKFVISGESFDLRPYFESFVLDTVLRAFFATEVDSANDSTNPLVLNSRRIFMKNVSIEQLIAIFSPTLSKMFDLRALDKTATNFMTKLIQRIIDERKQNNINRNDLLQILLDSNNDNSESFKIRLDDKEVIDNCIMLLVAGFDTTSSGLVNLAYNLVTNPSKQQKLIKEIDEKLNGIEPDFDNISQLSYLDACIKESLRLEPSLVKIERKPSCDYKFGHILIPKDTMISIPLKAVHRDPDNFENADEFIPERFLPENKHKIKPGTYAPFADGPRNCVGMRFALLEMKYCLAKLLKKYELVKCNETEPIEYYCGQIFAMPKRLILKVKKRSYD